MADAKLPDAQSGYEKGISNVLAGVAGLNLVYESVGMHASLLGFCPESLIIDDDMIAMCLRCVRGVEVDEARLSFDVIREVCLEGPGHYLGHGATLALMQREYVYPTVADRTSPKEWAEVDRPDLVAVARVRKEAILASPAQVYIDPAVDAEIRRRWAIHMPAAATPEPA
jgi:trimethylamine--corrinoid protein Co-methyltransferase